MTINQEWFDKADLNAATAFSLLTYYCVGIGQFETGLSYTNITRAMTKIIREQAKVFLFLSLFYLHSKIT